MSGPEREAPPFRKLRHNETCEACGHAGWCMASETTNWCMRQSEGAYHITTDASGYPVYLHHRDGVARTTASALPRRDERPDWERPDALACEILYTTIAERCADTPTPDAARAADERRFGAHAIGILAASDHVYIRDPEALVAWLASEGRTQDAKNAGVLTKQGLLSPALRDRKIFVYRDERGRVRDLKGRAYDGRTPKVRNLAGSREERGAASTWYHHGRIADATAQGGHLRIAGGHEKADALNLAVGATVGANEGQASDGMIAALLSAGIVVATIHADGEDPKGGKTISEGQRLAVALGERLEAAGIAVRIAEPLRSPGEPKLDADTILRDHGPAALCDIDRRAVPLAVYRRRIGDLQPHDAAHVAQLSELVARRDEQLAICGQEHRRKDGVIDALRTEVAAYAAALAHTDQTIGGCVMDMADELYARYQGGDTLVQDGIESVPLVHKRAAKHRGPQTFGKAVERVKQAGKVTHFERPIAIETEKFRGEVGIDHFHIPAEHRTSPAKIALYLLPPCAEKKHGGLRRRIEVPNSERHPDAPIKRVTERTDLFYCLADNELLKVEKRPDVVAYFAANGEALTPAEAEDLAVDIGAHPASKAPTRVPAYRPVQRRLSDTDADLFVREPVDLDNLPTPIPLHGTRCLHVGCGRLPGLDGRCGNHRALEAMTMAGAD